MIIKENPDITQEELLEELRGMSYKEIMSIPSDGRFAGVARAIGEGTGEHCKIPKALAKHIRDCDELTKPLCDNIDKFHKELWRRKDEQNFLE